MLINEKGLNLTKLQDRNYASQIYFNHSPVDGQKLSQHK